MRRETEAEEMLEAAALASLAAAAVPTPRAVPTARDDPGLTTPRADPSLLLDELVERSTGRALQGASVQLAAAESTVPRAHTGLQSAAIAELRTRLALDVSAPSYLALPAARRAPPPREAFASRAGVQGMR